MAANDTSAGGQLDADDDDLETTDYLVEIPELDQVPTSSLSVAPSDFAFSDLHTARPILKVGECIFHGKFQRSIGSTLVIARPQPHPLAPGSKRGRGDAHLADDDAGGADDEEEIEDATEPSAGNLSDKRVHKLVALTSTRLVFKLVTGDLHTLRKSGP